MDPSNQIGLGKIFKLDRCRKYLPRYDGKTFLQQVEYTEGQLIEYLPQRFVDEHENFQKMGTYIKVGFWVMDIAFVSFCHKIKLLTRVLGEKGWKMFAFKIAAVAFPLSFMDKIQQDAQKQFYQGLYSRVHKFYKRYKRTGDILDLNVNIILEDKQTELQRICHLNEFNLVHGLNEINEANKSKNVV